MRVSTPVMRQGKRAVGRRRSVSMSILAWHSLPLDYRIPRIYRLPVLRISLFQSDRLRSVQPAEMGRSGQL